MHELGLFTPDEMRGAFEANGLVVDYDPVGPDRSRALRGAFSLMAEGARRLANASISLLFPAADTPRENTDMYRISTRALTGTTLLALFATTAFAQNSVTPTAADATLTPLGIRGAQGATRRIRIDDVARGEAGDWPTGKTTALFYTGGTEQRGPQNVNGGHNLMGKATVKAIALKLGNAIAMPVLPYTPNNASATLPGTIGLTPEILAAILERISEQAITTGFKNVILMGDHGGGQPNVYREVAKKLDDKYAPQGIHVYYCDEVYTKAQADFDKWLVDNGYPKSSHAGIPDTSEMLYLGGDAWVRKDLIKTALGDPVPEPGTAARP